MMRRELFRRRPGGLWAPPERRFLLGASAAVVKGASGAGGGAPSLASIVDFDANVINSSALGSGTLTGAFTVHNTADLLYIVVPYRFNSNPSLTVTVSDVGGANPVAVTLVAETADGSAFNPGIWVGRTLPAATGTRQINVTPSVAWYAAAAHVVHVTGQSPSPDGNEAVNQIATGTTEAETIATTAGSLVLMAAAWDQAAGDATPFSPTDDTNEIVDAKTGGAGEDVASFVGWKQGTGGNVTVGCSSSNSDGHVAVTWECLAA